MTSQDFLHMGGKKIALVIHRDDNVAVTLADVRPATNASSEKRTAGSIR